MCPAQKVKFPIHSFSCFDVSEAQMNTLSDIQKNKIIGAGPTNEGAEIATNSMLY